MATKKAAPAAKPKKMVLVCTEYRGVFVGLLEQDSSPAHVDLSQVRNVIYWHQPGKGVLGLTSEGPSSQCKIGSPAPSLRAFKVTAIAELTDAARKKFEALS